MQHPRDRPTAKEVAAQLVTFKDQECLDIEEPASLPLPPSGVEKTDGGAGFSYDDLLGDDVVDVDVIDNVYGKLQELQIDYYDSIEEANRRLVRDGRPYVLIGFGRWGTSDPPLGVPVAWGQISGARVIVEATLPEVQAELASWRETRA